MLPAHFIGCRLALQIFIFRIFLQQAELGGKGTRGLPMCLRHRPQPGQIQMRIARRIEHRLRRAVHRFHNGPQLLYGLPVSGRPVFPVLLEIHSQRELLQRLRDLRCPQGSLVQRLQQFIQRIHIHIELIGILIPDAVSAHAQRPSLPFLQRILISPRQHRPCSTAVYLREIMTRIGFH